MLDDPPDPSDLPSALADLFLVIDHVGVAVVDLDAAIDFHVGTFGWRMVHREEQPEQGVQEAMLAAPGGGGSQAAQLQLLAPLGADSPIGRFLRDRGPGLQQVAYRVSDVERAADALRQRGLRLLYDRARIGTRGSLINFVHPRDTGGVLIELVQVAPADEPG